MARPLKMFMRGKKITMLQELLQRMGHPMQDKPGQFGSSTRDGVKNFQRQHGLKPTGSADNDLLSMMQQGPLAKNAKCEPADNNKGSLQSPANQQQLDALTRLLISKGIFTEEEFHQELLRPQPLRVTQSPLV